MQIQPVKLHHRASTAWKLLVKILPRNRTALTLPLFASHDSPAAGVPVFPVKPNNIGYFSHRDTF